MIARDDFTIGDALKKAIEEDADPFVRSLSESIATFARVTMRDVSSKDIALYFIGDQQFEELGTRLGTAEKFNRLSVSHVLRTSDAFRFSSILRASELLRTSLHCLNEDMIVGAAPAVRAFVELTALNLDAANNIFHVLKSVDWSAMDSTILGLNEEARDWSLHDYVEKLFFGARLEEHIESDRFKQTNILTVMERINTKLKVAADYDFLEKYKYACELVHPNRAGFDIYVSDVQSVDGYWFKFPLNAKARSGRKNEARNNLLWLLAFSVGNLTSVQDVYNATVLYMHPIVGYIYPKRGR